MTERLVEPKKQKSTKKKYLVRVAQTTEAEQDIKDYENRQTGSDFLEAERDRPRRGERREGFL